MYRRLRDMREDADKTQAELAAVLNVGQTTYSRYENGVLDIPSIALIALARYYQVSTDYLLGLLRERGFTGECLEVYYEPVTGAHVGPGTVALFFYGTEK